MTIQPKTDSQYFSETFRISLWLFCTLISHPRRERTWEWTICSKLTISEGKRLLPRGSKAVSGCLAGLGEHWNSWLRGLLYQPLKKQKPADIYLLRVDFNLVLSFRKQLNVICPVYLLRDDPDFILNWKLKGRQESGRLWLGLGHIPGQSLQKAQKMFLYAYTDMQIA